MPSSRDLRSLDCLLCEATREVSFFFFSFFSSKLITCNSRNLTINDFCCTNSGRFFKAARCWLRGEMLRASCNQKEVLQPLIWRWEAPTLVRRVLGKEKQQKIAVWVPILCGGTHWTKNSLALVPGLKISRCNEPGDSLTDDKWSLGSVCAPLQWFHYTRFCACQLTALLLFKGLGNSQREYERQVVLYSIRNQLRYRNNLGE